MLNDRIQLGEGIIGLCKTITKIETLDFTFTPAAIGGVISGTLIMVCTLPRSASKTKRAGLFFKKTLRTNRYDVVLYLPTLL